MKLIKPLLAVFSALLVVGCGSPVGVSATSDEIRQTTRSIVGTSLVGATGVSQEDQNKIDITVTRLCASNIWTQSECLQHDQDTTQ